MSKIKFSESAIGSLSRRLFLALGPASAVFTPVSKPAAASPSEAVGRAIRAHRNCLDYLGGLQQDLAEAFDDAPSEAVRSPFVDLMKALRFPAVEMAKAFQAAGRDLREIVGFDGDRSLIDLGGEVPGQGAPILARSAEEIDDIFDRLGEAGKSKIWTEVARARAHAAFADDSRFVDEAAEAAGLTRKRRLVEQFQRAEVELLDQLVAAPLANLDDARNVAKHLRDYLAELGEDDQDDILHRFIAAMASDDRERSV